jgi:hypothetical protein
MSEAMLAEALGKIARGNVVDGLNLPADHCRKIARDALAVLSTLAAAEDARLLVMRLRAESAEHGLSELKALIAGGKP